jgi:hypothetical protein
MTDLKDWLADRIQREKGAVQQATAAGAVATAAMHEYGGQVLAEVLQRVQSEAK